MCANVSGVKCICICLSLLFPFLDARLAHKLAHSTTLLEYWVRPNFLTHSKMGLGVARQASARWHKKPTYTYLSTKHKVSKEKRKTEVFFPIKCWTNATLDNQQNIRQFFEQRPFFFFYFGTHCRWLKLYFDVIVQSDSLKRYLTSWIMEWIQKWLT